MRLFDFNVAEKLQALFYINTLTRLGIIACKNYVITNCTVYTLRKILLGRSNQVGWGETGV